MKIRHGNNGSYMESTVNKAFLSSEFGESYARRIFGDTLVDTMPRYVRGKRKGKLKGFISWRKAVKGGWLSGVGVIARNKTFGHGIFLPVWGEEDSILAGVNTFCKVEANGTLV